MAVLSFSLTPEATGRIYEALVCLAKFGEAVAIEARGDKASFLHPIRPSNTRRNPLTD
jgi:cell cycle checkpoint control protein RAD9A